jgi:hypothetical protein
MRRCCGAVRAYCLFWESLILLPENFREALIKSGAQDAQSDFSSDCMKTTPLG